MTASRASNAALPCSEIANRCQRLLSSTKTSQRIQLEIEKTEGDSQDYWDFKDSKKQGFEDSLFQYPQVFHGGCFGVSGTPPLRPFVHIFI